MNVADIRTLMDVREIALSGGTCATYQNPAPRMRPFRIFADDKDEQVGAPQSGCSLRRSRPIT